MPNTAEGSAKTADTVREKMPEEDRTARGPLDAGRESLHRKDTRELCPFGTLFVPEDLTGIRGATWKVHREDRDAMVCRSFL